MNKNKKFKELVTCDWSQDVHSSYEKNETFWVFTETVHFHRNLVQIIMGLEIVYFKWNYTWR